MFGWHVTGPDGAGGDVVGDGGGLWPQTRALAAVKEQTQSCVPAPSILQPVRGRCTKTRLGNHP